VAALFWFVAIFSALGCAAVRAGCDSRADDAWFAGARRRED